MTPEMFTYWLQGFAELTVGESPNAPQWAVIKEHLQLVFKKETKLTTVLTGETEDWEKILGSKKFAPQQDDNPLTPMFPHPWPKPDTDWAKWYPPTTITC